MTFSVLVFECDANVRSVAPNHPTGTSAASIQTEEQNEVRWQHEVDKRVNHGPPLRQVQDFALNQREASVEIYQRTAGRRLEAVMSATLIKSNADIEQRTFNGCGRALVSWFFFVLHVALLFTGVPP